MNDAGDGENWAIVEKNDEDSPDTSIFGDKTFWDLTK